MYNEDIPTRAELPTSRQLIRSTLIAVLSAFAILMTIVLPSEYGIDPTGIGRTLGLAEMGEIKKQLSKEAEADRLQGLQKQKAAPSEEKSNLFDSVGALLFIKQAAAQTTPTNWKDEVAIVLKPGQGTEVKMVMVKDAIAKFSWMVENGVANFDLHGDGGGRSISYKKGRGVPGGKGTLKAAFAGNHGWFWRNRTKRDITIILKVSGDYSKLKKTR